MKEQPARSLVLASEALSLLLRNDRKMVARVEASRQVGVPVHVPTLTIVEAVHGKTDLTRLKWVLSRVRVEPAGQEDSLTAVELLQYADGLHGHKHAIDALVTALALRVPAPVVILTPDRDDWARPCESRVIIKEV
ncbi:DNA-binding protein [Streptomyces sp. NPDC091204]|uniref:DNA-binding protein n=1 Tax=Streptomyces sp. NPDC091204 TaxID=3155299 RepID=UPI0034374C43